MTARSRSSPRICAIRLGTPWLKILLPSLINHAKPENWETYREVVIVPDGALWYLPFEMLPIGDGDETVPLISKIRIRYVPTVGLAVPDGRPLKPQPKTAAVSGRLYPREDLNVPAAALEHLAQRLPDGLT